MSTYKNAVDAVREHIEYISPETESEALEAGYEALNQFIDNQLIYTHNILELWDGSTHEEISLGDHEEIMSAITASTYYQLHEEWAEAVYDAVDGYIEANLSDEDAEKFNNGVIFRDEALDLINGGK